MLEATLEKGISLSRVIAWDESLYQENSCILIGEMESISPEFFLCDRKSHRRKPHHITITKSNIAECFTVLDHEVFN